MSRQVPATRNPMSPRTNEWFERAQVIVSRPEEFGMTRHDVLGLARLLAAIEPPVSHRAAQPHARYAA